MSYALATCPTEGPAVIAPPPMDEARCARRRVRPRVGRPPIEDSIELVMPAQFHTPASEAWWPGEKRLMLAVLTDAIEILMKGQSANGPRRRELFEETVAWFDADDTEWPYSFVNVCDTLGLESRAVRAAVRHRCARARRPPRESDSAA